MKQSTINKTNINKLNNSNENTNETIYKVQIKKCNNQMKAYGFKKKRKIQTEYPAVNRLDMEILTI